MFSCKRTDKHTVEVPLPYEFADDTLIKYVRLYHEEYKDKIVKLLNNPYNKLDGIYPRPFISIAYYHNNDTDLFIIHCDTWFDVRGREFYGILIYIDNIPCIIERTRSNLSPLLADNYLEKIQNTYKKGPNNSSLWIHGFSKFWYLTFKNGEFVSLEIKD
jgi:hypothetical protein